MFWGELCTPYFHQSFKADLLVFQNHWNYICSCYLDDTFILGRTFQETLKHTEIVFDTLVALGFVPKIPKCSLIPSTRIRHLGFYIDSSKMTVELPQDKIDTTEDLETEICHSTSPVTTVKPCKEEPTFQRISLPLVLN